MLTFAIFLPLLGLFALLPLPKDRPGLHRAVATAASGATLAVWIGLWIVFRNGQGYQFVERVPWIRALGVGYRVGVDGLSLPLLVLTALLFVSAIVFSASDIRRSKEYYGWFLFLESACLGVFAALDLFLFYVFWDLTLVGMYFIIAIWGHRNARAAALQFFIYTLAGSLALLLGIIVLYLATQPYSADMVVITRQQPLREGGFLAGVAFFALLVGFAIKTPLAPVHTWLPPAHGEAPAAGSAILAGVMLKMGTYGFLRILWPMLPRTFQHYAWLVIALGVLSVIYGALVALAQTNVKRLIAYTSVNHMGYVIMAIGAAGLLAHGSDAARVLAINGAILQMVSHGLITGALFLLSGVLWRRTQTFEFGELGGLARVTPVFAGATALAAFASLGLPGLSGFVAEFEIFVGTFNMAPVAAIVALPGIVITAALFLWALQRLFFGEPDKRWQRMADMSWRECLATLPLLALIVVIGIFPAWVLAPIDAFSHALVGALK
jgi:NADH-quinone oxidoreductase subunit M